MCNLHLCAQVQRGTAAVGRSSVAKPRPLTRAADLAACTIVPRCRSHGGGADAGSVQQAALRVTVLMFSINGQLDRVL